MYAPLAPEWYTMVQPYLYNEISQEEYTRRYQARLDVLNPHKVAKELGDNVVLLCYEPSDKFCHRHLAARWLTLNGYPVKEYIYEKPLSPTLVEEWKF